VKLRLNKKHLDNELNGIFQLQVDPLRVAYVPKDEGDKKIGERGLPECILTYKSTIPTPEQEPELYAIPHEKDPKQPDEVWLKYRDATVILITEKEDDKFRKENKDLIERIEALYVE